MALPNPTINPPLFPMPPGHSRRPSRSPSTSPERRARNFSHHSDPLLRDLSPSSTLRAFTASSSAAADKSEDQLVRSIETATNTERAFGIRVAQTCKDLRAWSAEVEQWQWPDTFEPPPVEERAAKRQRMLSDYNLLLSDGSSLSYSHSAEDEQEDFWGCLPNEIVIDREARLDDLADAMHELDVESLKAHIRNVHIQPHSTYDPQQAQYTTTRLNHMDDFTALVTATILQALPHLSRLNRLMHEWSVRLLVLRKVPGFLRELAEAQAKLEGAWGYITGPSRDPVAVPDYHDKDGKELQQRFETTWKELENKISALGQRLDSMLDDLEGKPETVPGQWIDRFETLEAAYSVWVTDTERKVIDLRWEQSRKQHSRTFKHPDSGMSFDALGIAQSQHGHLNGVEAHPAAFGIAELADSSKGLDKDRISAISPISQHSESPTLGHEPFAFWKPETSSSGVDVGDGRPTSDLSDSEPITDSVLLDSVVDEAQDQAQLPQASNAGQSHADHRRGAILNTSPIKTREVDMAPPSPSSHTPSPTKRSRHVPIDVSAYRDGPTSQSPTKLESPTKMESPTKTTTATEDAFAFNQSSALPPLDMDSASSTDNGVAARTRMFNGQLEQKQLLLKAKSPVRPFEHASQAFTKLFSRSNSQKHSRTSSAVSRTSSKKTTPVLGSSRRNSTSSKRASGQSVAATSGVAGSDDRRAAQQADWSEKELASTTHPGLEAVKASDDMRRHDSPFMTEETSSNWPLPNMKMVDDEISTPASILKSDYFERLFVDTLPETLDRDDSHMKEEDPRDMVLPYEWKPNGLKELSLSDGMLESREPMRARDDYMGTAITSDAPDTPRQKLSFGGLRPGHARNVSELSMPGSVATGASTPEIRDAFEAGYFRPTEVETPPVLSCMPSSTTILSRSQGYSGGALSPVSPRLKIPGTDLESVESFGEEMVPKRAPSAKRASVASIEHFARSDLKTIKVQRSPSVSSASSIPGYNLLHETRFARLGAQPPPMHSEPSSPAGAKKVADFLPDRSNSMREHLAVPQTLRSDSERSVLGSNLGASKPLPLAYHTSTSQVEQMGDDADYFAGSSSSGTGSIAPPAKSDKRMSRGSGDSIDRHVSSVLRTVPARIRFDPTPSATHAQQSSPTNRKPHFRTPGARNGAKSPQPGGLTLAPAFPNSSHQKITNEPDMKLYHLRQEGKDQPLKLFIRLVGENERVMVRVGGGWADLAEYLRQYAEHHGHRTTTGSQIEVQEAPASSPRVGGSGGGKTRTPLNKPSSVLGTPRPESALGFYTSPSSSEPRTQTQSPDLDTSSSPPTSSPMPVSTPHHAYKTSDSTPKSTSSKSTASRPESRLAAWAGDEIGLAGPAGKGKGRELDESKAKWVEDMIARAKGASAGVGTEKKKGGEEKKGGNERLVLTDVGRVGSTRRVVFKAGEMKE